LHRRNKRVPFDQRNNAPQSLRIVYPPILDINHFRHFLVTIENLYPMDDEPMWVADRVVAPTTGSAITIPDTANEFAIKVTNGNPSRVNIKQLCGRVNIKQLCGNIIVKMINLSSGKAYVEGEIVSKAFKILSMRVVTQDCTAA
nr:hypothetical protein [Tanacetum cinerariifolium]